MIDAKQRVITSILEARGQLESALAELETLPAFDSSSVSFAAHSLSNFLSIADGTVEMIMGLIPRETDPQVLRLLEGLRHAGNLMMRIVSHMMSNAAITELKFQYEHFDLAHLVHRACAYYQRLAVRKNIHLTMDFTSDVPIVWSDRVAVAAIMDNLLSNAVKYSPIGKTIHVMVSKSGEDAFCSVRDEGPGISPEDQGHLFKRGVRLGAVPSGGEPSAGYGLAVAKELVERLGGAIWVDSEPGHGACFSFRLPTPTEGSANRD
jgi:signal transduction histidine kinase